MSKYISIINPLRHSIFKNSFIFWVYNYITYSLFFLSPTPSLLSFQFMAVYSLIVIICMYTYLYTYIAKYYLLSLYIITCMYFFFFFYYMTLCFRWGSESIWKSRQNRQPNWKHTEWGLEKRGWSWEELSLNMIKIDHILEECTKIS